MELRDRVALVTGAGKRVGRAIAIRLARAGCSVAVHYNRSADAAAETVQQCNAAGRAADLFQTDLFDAEAAVSLVSDVRDRFGRLDVLVNNASVFEPMKLDAFELEAWEKTLRTNLTAPMVLTHAARQDLRRARGRVVNLCDISTARPWPDHIAYAVSKGGLDTLTRVLARAMAPEVNVVGIAPGVAAWPESYDAATRERLEARIPLQRPGTPEDIAAAVDFVLREGDYISGAIIPIDGGRHIV